MSSLPTSSPLLLATPIPGSAARRGHGHRRSAAISGDFDAMGLGLFSPPGTGAGNTPSKKPSLSDFDIDKHFQLNNDEDFVNPDKNMDFSFPNVSTSPNTNAHANYLHSASVPSPRNSAIFTSPPKRLLNHHSFNSLNSPIRLGRKSQHFHMPPKTRFFLTEETQLNSESGVPDAVIDLDEVLSANLHIGDQSGGNSNNSSSTHLPQPQLITSHTHGRSHSFTPSSSKDMNGINSASPMVAPFEMYPDENDCTLLSSSCFKLYPSPFISSPLSTNNNPLFQQPIQEMDHYTDDLQEVVEIEIPKEADGESEVGRLPNSASASDIEQEIFPNPQTALVGLYSNDSANSSCSSLRSSNTARNVSNPLIEKTFSNDSTNNYSNPNFNTPPSSYSNPNQHGKRSGAKATRYQSFYDQSFKISNALKISSTESVNIVRTTSNDSGGSFFPKEVKILGHSSSLPSLKTVLNKRSNQKLRFNEVRISSAGMPSSVGPAAAGRKLSPPVQVNAKETIHGVQSGVVPKTLASSSSIAAVVPPINSGSKNISNSPISINSEISSTIISSNATIQSTEHSSLHEQQTNSFASKDSEQHTITDVPTPLIVVSAEDDIKSKPPPISIPEKSSDLDKGVSSPTNSITVTISNTSPSKKTGPTSAISPISASLPALSTISATSNDGTRNYLPQSNTQSRRPLSPKEKSFLKQTQIPSYKPPSNSKKSLTSSPTSLTSPSSTAKSLGPKPKNSRSSLFSLLQNNSIQPLQQPALSNNRLQNLNNAYSHRKSHSVTLLSGQENENDDLRSLQLSSGKRKSRFINWLKKKY